MNTSQVAEIFDDRFEITIWTDAELDLSARHRCETEIRKFMNMNGVEIGDVSFQKGSTIITIMSIVGAGLAFCFANYLIGVLKKLGERSAELLLTDAGWDNKSTSADQVALATTNDEQPSPATVSPVNHISYIEFPGMRSNSIDVPREIAALMMSAESTGQALLTFVNDLPGNEKSITVAAVKINKEAQERVVEIYQRKVSKL